MAKNRKTEDLLRILGQKQPMHSAHPVKIEPDRPAPRPHPARSAAKHAHMERRAKKSTRGKAVQFWLHPEDEKLIRELAVWLTPHRRRVNNSRIIAAVLRAAKTGQALLTAYDEASAVAERSWTRPQRGE